MAKTWVPDAFPDAIRFVPANDARVQNSPFHYLGMDCPGIANFEDGLHLDFSSNPFCYRKVAGSAPVIQALTSLFTFSGGNQSLIGGPNGLLRATSTNIPRIDYDERGNCLGLLIEAARTNLAIQSADLTGYALTNVTIGGNAIAAPDGTTTADSITETVTSGLHRAQATSVGVANVSNTFSCFIKAGLRTKGRIVMGGASGSTIANFDLGAVTATPVTPSGNGTCTAATITALANGWFRVTATGVPDSTSGLTFAPRIDLADAAFSFSYAGDSGSVGLYAWGLQVEQAAFASSYIPTTTAAVTRTADSCTRTLSTEFSGSTGTFVVDFATRNTNTSSFAVACVADDGTTNERLAIWRNNVGTRSGIIIDGGATTLSAAGGNSGLSFQKTALAYAASDHVFYAGGTQIGATSSGTLPTVTTLRLGTTSYGADELNGWIRSFHYYPTRKPNAFLAARTTA